MLIFNVSEPCYCTTCAFPTFKLMRSKDFTLPSISLLVLPILFLAGFGVSRVAGWLMKFVL